MIHKPDAVIVGGGPAGGSAGLALARAGWSVLLCERKAFPRRKVCGEYLSATNLPLLDHLGLGEVFRQRAGPEVSRVGLFVGEAMLEAQLPLPPEAVGWGRALGRETLDSLLLDQARQAGVEPLLIARHRVFFTQRHSSCSRRGGGIAGLSGRNLVSHEGQDRVITAATTLTRGPQQ